MSEVSRRLLTVTFITVAAGFLFFLAVATFAFPVQEVLGRYQWGWITRHALAELIDAIPALQIFAVTLTFSLLINVMEIRANRGEVPSFFSLVNGPLVFLLVVTAAYAILVAVAAPALVSVRNELEAKTTMARRFRREAEFHIEEGAFELAATELRHYLAIDPEDGEALDLLEEVSDRLETRALRDGEEQPSQAPRISERRNLSAAESVGLAERYFEEENYISALYYARLAKDLDPNRDDAARIVGLALERLSQEEPSVQEREERWVFTRKREGYRAFEQGRYLDAYYLFQDLAERYPADPDVRVYLPRIRSALQEQAFFLEEILPIVALTGGTDLVFLNRPEDPGLEYVSIDKVINARSGRYAIGIEALGVGLDGAVRYHLAAPYGKLQDGTLNMRAVSETEAGYAVTPEYFAGSRPAELRNTIMLSVPVTDLMTIAKANAPLESASLGELFRMTAALDSYGYGKQRPRTELLRRLLEPFSFIVLALFAIGLAWQLRSRYVARPPIGALLIVPLLPFALYYGYSFYRFAMRIVATHLMLHVGMAGAVAAAVGVQAVLLAAALFYVATRMAE